MFVRKKKNKSGVISVQVIDKSGGRYKVIQTIGSSADVQEVERLVEKGKEWITKYTGTLTLDFTDYGQHTRLVLQGLEEISVYGPELLLGKIFDQIGFNRIEEPLFRQLVLARLCYPASKLKTTDYLSKYQHLRIDVQVIYRYLDKLYNHQKEQVQQISYQHTVKILGSDIRVVFYDVTTIYFESEQEDGFRKTGFSKEGKHQHPQLVLGLLVSRGGYPLAYDIFQGSQFEGHTMLPVVETFKERYGLDKLVVVADAGLLSKENIALLQQKGYQYIIGARIKTEGKAMQEKILALHLSHGQSAVLAKDENTRLVVSYSQNRAAKDAHNRQRGLAKLEKQVKSGKLTKANINNRGYNKFLRMDEQVSISIDRDKIQADSQWDGLKGYLTNTDLSKEEIISHYKELWQIEKAFRIAKTDLQIRPVYHRLRRRIEAHICIAFVAYKVYRELERQLKDKASDLSAEKAIEIAKTIYALKIRHPITGQITQNVHIKSDEQRKLAKLFNFESWVSQ